MARQLRRRAKHTVRLDVPGPTVTLAAEPHLLRAHEVARVEDATRLLAVLGRRDVLAAGAVTALAADAEDRALEVETVVHPREARRVTAQAVDRELVRPHVAQRVRIAGGAGSGVIAQPPAVKRETRSSRRPRPGAALIGVNARCPDPKIASTVAELAEPSAPFASRTTRSPSRR